MNSLIIVASCLLAVASANPGLAGIYAGAYATPYSGVYGTPYATPYAVPYAQSVSSQYHAQDELGQYSYGYSGGPSAKTESRTADGITRGGYSYVDANGIVQSTSYVSDPINGFRVAATNLPVAPAAQAVPVAHAGLIAPVQVADTVEVAAAKAAHFQAHAAAKAGHYAVAAPLAYAHAAPIALATEARLIDPVAIAAGAPLPTGDTVEVAAAKAQHFQAHAIARSNHFLRYKRGLAYAAPLSYAAYAPRNFGYSSVTAHGSPLAYAGYAHASPLAYAAPIALASEARQIDPVAIAAGAPLPTGDTIEVAAAKAAHLQAHAVETARNYGVYAHGSPLAYAGYAHAAPLAYSGWQSPLAYAQAPIALASEARQIDPVAIAAGAPLPTGDTIEVAAAKAAHLQAHAAATARNHGAYAHASPLAYSAGLYAHAAPQLAYSAGHYAHASPLAYNGYAHAAPLALASEARLIDPVAIAAGAPLPTGDTVEVAAAKAQHFQAHAIARSNHGLRYKRGLAAIAYGAHPVAHSAVAYPSAHHVVAYNAPLVAAAHPVARYTAYSAPIVHAPAHHAVYAPALSHATSYSSVSQVSHPVAHYGGAYAHHY